MKVYGGKNCTCTEAEGQCKNCEAKEAAEAQAETEHNRLQAARFENFKEDVAACRGRGHHKPNPDGRCPICDGVICGN